MSFSLKEKQKIQALLLSEDESNVQLALTLLTSEQVPTFARSLMLRCSFYKDKTSMYLESYLLEHLKKQELEQLQLEIMILFYAQHQFNDKKGWNHPSSILQYFLKEHERVLEKYINLFQHNPKLFSKLYTLLAKRIRDESKSSKKALPFYIRGLDMDPDSPSANLGYAMCMQAIYLQNGKKVELKEKIIQAYLKAYKGPKNINCYLQAAMLCEVVEDYVRAEKLYQKALSLVSSEAKVHNAYAYFLWKQKGDYTRAEEYARIALNLAKEDASIIDTLAHTLLSNKKFEEAEHYFLSAVKLLHEDDRHHSYSGLGILYSQLNKRKQAEYYLLKGLYRDSQFYSRRKQEVLEKLTFLMHFYKDFKPKEFSECKRKILQLDKEYILT